MRLQTERLLHTVHPLFLPLDTASQGAHLGMLHMRMPIQRLRLSAYEVHGHVTGFLLCSGGADQILCFWKMFAKPQAKRNLMGVSRSNGQSAFHSVIR